MHVHLVIPAFRESERLPFYLERLLPELNHSGLEFTVRVVDDGSGEPDRHLLRSELKNLRAHYPHLLLETCWLQENLGKGGAVYAGWHQAPDCEVLGFLDADGSIPAPEVVRMARRMERAPDTAWFASRIRMLGRSITRSERRHYIGRLYATMIGNLLKIPVYDSQCGFKLLPANRVRKILPQCRENGFAFDLELLLLLFHEACPVREMPIDWHDTPGSKVRLVRDSFRMALTVLRLKRRFSSHA
ncbi:MAG: glycosyltransferase [Candidatus Methylacidiphilales bacterium]